MFKRERPLQTLSDFKWTFIGERRLKQGGLLLEDLPQVVLGSNPVAVFSYYGIFLDSSRKTNGNVLEMKLKDFIFFDGQIEIKSTIPIFIPERKQKCLSQK